MTTPAAESLYVAMHRYELEGRKRAIFNPHNKPLEDLPVIYGFNNGGQPGRHETFREHYPDGYRMEFVPGEEVRARTCEGLMTAYNRNQADAPPISKE